MATPTIRTPHQAPKAPELQDAHKIVGYAHDTAKSLLAGFNSLGEEHGRGAPTDERQDLLRAMLVFAGAGLDACAQQVVRDALPRLAASHAKARSALETYAARRLRQGEGGASSTDPRVLAKVLVGDPEKNLIALLIDDLTGSSMQSVEELKRVARHLGVVADKLLMRTIDQARDAFRVRNRIAHDMDIDFRAHLRRNRNIRRRDDMVRHANALLAVADDLVVSVDKLLQRI